MKYAIALLMALTLNAVANLMMKFGVIRFRQARLQVDQGLAPLVAGVLSNWVLMLGLIFFAGNVILYTIALSGIRISVAYPIMVGGGFVIISIVAWRFLGEHLSAAQWVGVALILLGVYLVAREMRPAAMQ